MTTQAVLAVLLDVEARIADPRRWLQGAWIGYRDSRGLLHLPHSLGFKLAPSNCWCTSQAISLAIEKVLGSYNQVTWTELRSDVEREILTTVGGSWPAVSVWNDNGQTSHAVVTAALRATRERLQEAA